MLTEWQSKQLLYSRFVNTRGGKGKNVPCDLHMAHLNKICKECVRDLGSNKTVTEIQRASKALGAVHPILQQFDKINYVSVSSGRHKKPTCREEIHMITEEIHMITSECKKYSIFYKGHKHVHFAFKDQNPNQYPCYILNSSLNY